MSTTPAGIVPGYRPGHALCGQFYTDEGLYQAELARIWHQDWLLAAVSAELPGPGSYVVYTVGTQSAIIVRREDAAVAAYHNVCRIAAR